MSIHSDPGCLLIFFICYFTNLQSVTRMELPYYLINTFSQLRKLRLEDVG
jgi:hypothetical protein